MSLAKTCWRTLYDITTTHLHLCSGKKTSSTKCFQFLFCFSFTQIRLRNVLISSTRTFCFSALFVCPSLKLYNQALPLQVQVEAPLLTPLTVAPAFVHSSVPRGCHLFHIELAYVSPLFVLQTSLC